MEKNYEAIGKGLEIVAPLLTASMEHTYDLNEVLMKANIQSGYRDGFEAGVIEGMKRQGIYTREILGIFQKEPASLGPSAYLRQSIAKGEYPYSMMTEADLREDW